MTTPLNAQVLVSGNDITAHLVDLNRAVILENPGAKVNLQFDAGLSWGALAPWNDLVVSENGTLTFTGFVDNVIVSRAAGEVKVVLTGTDSYKRCQNWFIDDNLYTGGPDAILSSDKTSRTLNYYVTYLCNLCGISFSINDSAGATFIMKSDTPLGLRTVSDALVTLSGIAQWCMRVDPNGVLQFDHINHPTSPDFTFTNNISFEEDLNDTDTKNDVKIWGFQDLMGGSILVHASRAVTGVPDTRTMVYAIPELTTVAEATALANAALDQWAALEHLAILDTLGDPALQVGESIRFNHPHLTSGSYLDTVTDLRATLGAGGYHQDLTAGRRAFRYPYWPVGQVTPPPPPRNLRIIAAIRHSFAGALVFATTTWGDVSPVWYTLSTGLSGEHVMVATSKGFGATRAYAITDAGLFYHSDITNPSVHWTHQQTIAQIATVIQASSPYGGNFYPPSGGSNAFYNLYGLATDPTAFTHLAFQVEVVNNDASWEGVFTLFSLDDGATIAVTGTGFVVASPFGADPGLIQAGSTSFGPFNDQGSTSFTQKTAGAGRLLIGASYGFGIGTSPFDAGDNYLDGPALIGQTGYHIRGGATNNRILWVPDGAPNPGVVYRQDGAIASGTHTLTPDTGLIYPIGGDYYLPNAIGMAIDGSVALGLDKNGHAWMNAGTGVHNWTDQGSLGMGTGVRCILGLPPDSGVQPQFAAASNTFKRTLDNGATWIDQGSIFGGIGGIDVVSMDYQ